MNRAAAAPTVAALLREASLPRLELELLLAAALERRRSWLFAHPEAVPGAASRSRYRSLVAARARGEPVAYLLGRREFWSLDLAVTPATLIPRPETELLVQLALELLDREAPATVVDLGTGSGAIALALARERPQCRIIATEVSTAAVRVAAENARAAGLGQVRFLCAHWLEPFRRRAFDLVVANPPYVAADDPHLDRGDVRFEPRAALVADANGRGDLDKICRAAAARLKPGGHLLLEHGWSQQPWLTGRLAELGYRNIQGYRDDADTPRAVQAVAPG